MTNDESGKSPSRPSDMRTHLTPQDLLVGGLVGGLVGAVVRGGITLLHLRWGGEFGVVASLPSAGIGFLCGAIAGSFCRGWLGAIVGAALSAGVFGLFLLPIAYLASSLGIGGEVAQLSWPLLLQKAGAGAIAGGVGGFVGGRAARAKRHA